MGFIKNREVFVLRVSGFKHNGRAEFQEAPEKQQIFCHSYKT